LNFGFLEENFKDKLQDILKELKTCMTNEKGARELRSIPPRTPIIDHHPKKIKILISPPNHTCVLLRDGHSRA
jgi:hypothetical protein